MRLSHFHMEQDLIMPVSALQHRVTAGAYQNKLHDNIRGSSTTQTQSLNSDRSIPDEIHHAGSSINRVVNSHEGLSRPQTTSPRQGIAAPLLMLLSQVRLADTLVAAAGRTTVSGSEIKHPVSENVEQSDYDNNLLSTLWNPVPQTLSRAGEFVHQHDPLRFPEASALPAGGYQNKAINRFSRYAVFQPKTTTPSSVPDDVKIEKLDFSCIEERQNLSISDVFRQIGKTLSNPVSELTKESQVIHYYNNYHRCPTPEEMSNLLSITSAVDKTISIIIALLPGSQPLVVTQRVGGPLFRMIADSIDNKQLNVDDLSEANDQLLVLGKSIVDTCPKNPKGQIIESQLRVPDGLSFKNNKLSVNVKGVDRELAIENGNYFANVNGKRRRISYSSEYKKWTKTQRYIEISGDNVSFQHHIGKLLSGSIDKKTLTSIIQNQHGIYTLTSKKSAESFHAIKIGHKFYRYIPGNKQDVSLSGVIKTDNADIRVIRFDKRYFIVNEKKKFPVNYSPCRLGRSPGSSCLHLSDGLTSKLKAHRKNGILERKIRGLKPSENNPGLYESAKGTVYLKYDDVYFKLIRLENGVADSQFMITGKKRFGSKEVTPVCFSREQGFNYVSTPLENMMESAGMSRAEAMSHIETSSGVKIKENVNRYNGLVSSSSNEMFKDSKINSLTGLYVRKDIKLNEAWSLKGVNVRNKNFSKNGSVGSCIDVTFTMHYDKLKNNKYIEMPPLQWHEEIDFKEGHSKWHFQANMYNHNPKSMTFFPWVNRYVEAYNFAKSKDKTSFHGNVKIYKNNMEPVDVSDIKSASTPFEKAKNIQSFLSKKGGFMEITITDLPQIFKREAANIKERKLAFNIGFNNEVVTHFNQGIYLDTSGETNVFVTTSDNIKLARGDANIQPPERVTKPREHHFSPGEIYLRWLVPDEITLRHVMFLKVQRDLCVTESWGDELLVECTWRLLTLPAEAQPDMTTVEDL